MLTFCFIGIRMVIIVEQLQTWTGAIVHRTICKIIHRDAVLVVGDYIEWPLPGCGSCVTITNSSIPIHLWASDHQLAHLID